MGRGIALQAANRYPNIKMILGKKITRNGNIVQILIKDKNTNIISFPVKPKYARYDGYNVVQHMKNRFKIGDFVPGWAAIAKLQIIEKSIKQLINLANTNKWMRIGLIMPGIGAGELNFDSVMNLLKKYIETDIRFIIYYLGNK